MGSTDYLLERSSQETLRLQRQARIWNFATRPFLERAGLRKGQRVLDLGCGPGDVTLLAAELVGPEGQVVSLDVDPVILETARARSQALALTNTTYLVRDIQALDLEGPFDAIIGRFVLQHLSEPLPVLQRLFSLLRPGGFVAFEEFDFTHPTVAYPPSALAERWDAWIKETTRRAGKDPQFGVHLPHLLLQAGFRAPEMRSDTLLFHGEDHAIMTYVVDLLHAILPRMLSYGIVAPGEIDFASFAQRWSQELLAQNSVVRAGLDVISVRAQRPLA